MLKFVGCAEIKIHVHKLNLSFSGKQLQYNAPQLYDTNIPSFADIFPDIVTALKKKHVTSAPWQRETKLQSLKGVNFISFAKYKKFNAGNDSVCFKVLFAIILN